MPSVKEMSAFSNFLLQLHSFKFEWLGKKKICLSKNGIPVYTFDVIRRKEKTLLRPVDCDHGDSTTRRFMQLVRFYLASRRDDITVRCLHFYNVSENDCKRNRCFAYLRDAFFEDWMDFQKGGRDCSLEISREENPHNELLEKTKGHKSQGEENIGSTRSHTLTKTGIVDEEESTNENSGFDEEKLMKLVNFLTVNGLTAKPDDTRNQNCDEPTCILSVLSNFESNLRDFVGEKYKEISDS